MQARAWKWILLLPIVFILYLLGLNWVGLLGPDEPRYAAIGRAMAESGDWVTPRLWGKPWFEKPALLYWMIGGAYRLGLNDDWAPRLPVALLSVTFLAFFFVVLRSEFDHDTALLSTVVLGTSAGWLAFSQIGVTDIPLSAAFTGSVLLGQRWRRTGSRQAAALSGTCLGLAVLAKGLVPLVLILPFCVAACQRWRGVWLPVLTCLATALPWYLLCFQQNGVLFWDDFIVRHHWQRFSSAEAIQHGQQFWFYIPVLLGALFPWTPLLALCRWQYMRDSRTVLIVATLLWGLLFFSASRNKLPGYLLPLLPFLSILLGLALRRTSRAPWVLASCALLLAALPAVMALLPIGIARGISKAHLTPSVWWTGLPIALLAFPVFWCETRGHRRAALGGIVLALTAGVWQTKWSVYPQLDQLVSARPSWHSVAGAPPGEVCRKPLRRTAEYGIRFYSRDTLPECVAEPRPRWLEEEQGVVVLRPTGFGPSPEFPWLDRRQKI